MIRSNRTNNRTNNLFPQERHCYFCFNKIKEIDYKNTQILQKFTSSYAKILGRRRTGVCAKHQRKLSQAIKRARFMALLPFVPQ